jgi:hypothetical protein
MKTINPNMFIFETLKQATSAFNKINSGHLLFAPKFKMYFVDVAKEALEAWPQHYELLEDK